MKRIDDKIKEIEKKDKSNRIKYIGVIVLIGGFIAYGGFSEQAKKRLGATIDAQKGTIEQQLVQVRKDSATIQAQLTALEESLNPEKFWNHIKGEGSHEAYINYITDKLEIDKSKYLPVAIETLTASDLEGFKGWLYCGSKKNDGTYTSRKVVEVFFRDGVEVTDNAIKNSEPKIGDIVKLIEKTNRRTYPRNNKSGTNEQGFRNKTRAFVSNVWKDPGSINFEIEIKYY